MRRKKTRESLDLIAFLRHDPACLACREFIVTEQPFHPRDPGKNRTSKLLGYFPEAEKLVSPQIRTFLGSLLYPAFSYIGLVTFGASRDSGRLV